MIKFGARRPLALTGLGARKLELSVAARKRKHRHSGVHTELIYTEQLSTYAQTETRRRYCFAQGRACAITLVRLHTRKTFDIAKG